MIEWVLWSVNQCWWGHTKRGRTPCPSCVYIYVYILQVALAMGFWRCWERRGVMICLQLRPCCRGTFSTMTYNTWFHLSSKNLSEINMFEVSLHSVRGPLCLWVPPWCSDSPMNPKSPRCLLHAFSSMIAAPWFPLQDCSSTLFQRYLLCDFSSLISFLWSVELVYSKTLFGSHAGVIYFLGL